MREAVYIKDQEQDFKQAKKGIHGQVEILAGDWHPFALGLVGEVGCKKKGDGP